MTKAGNGDWKTPLGYYERAIEEIRRAREEFQVELQKLKEMKASEIELSKLQAELESCHREIQALKAKAQSTEDFQVELQKLKEMQASVIELPKEIQALKAKLETTNSDLTTARKIAKNAQTEIQALKAELQSTKANITSELTKIKEELSQFREVKEQKSNSRNDSQILESLSTLRLQVSKLEAEVTLVSHASGIDYTKLRDLLAEKKWKEADTETYNYILRLSGREGERWLDDGNIKAFYRNDLRVINNLWEKYSNRKFGFRAQKRIWEDSQEDYKRFGDRIGWLLNLANNEWRTYEKYIFNLGAPDGHLPSTSRIVGLGSRNVGELPHRLKIFFSHY